MLNTQSAEAVARDNRFTIAPGDPLPFGATITPDGINFSVYSRYASTCTLVLFRRGERLPFAEIAIPPEYRIGDVFPIKVAGLDPREIEYGYRMDGPHDPAAGHRFDPSQILLDPYATTVGGRELWGKRVDADNPFQHRARILDTKSFDWGMDRPLNRPIEDTII